MSVARALIGLTLAAAAGCSSTNDGTTSSTEATCTPVVASDPKPRATASAAEVKAILASNCAVGGCHASAPGAGKLVLDVSSTAWIDAVVGVPSRENPSMNMVTPGDPTQSWLAHKIVGDFCSYACDPSVGCGLEMPFGAAIPAADRDTIFGWIKNGAPRD